MEPLGKRKPYKEGKARESPREDIHAEGKREIGYARDGEGKERVYGYMGRVWEEKWSISTNFPCSLFIRSKLPSAINFRARKEHMKKK